MSQSRKDLCKATFVTVALAVANALSSPAQLLMTILSNRCLSRETAILEQRPLVMIRRASPSDAAGIAAVVETIAAERIHSAIDRAWTSEEESRYLTALSTREALHVAFDAAQGIVGFQSLDLWSPVLDSMAHVGQVGTFLLPGWRGRGVGRQLWSATRSFARDAGYRKLVIQVRASNTAAQAFYRGLGFQECGRLSRQVIIDGVEDDELLMEFFFL
jgi:ribosomal protein S18 acetylase RimI-like enzyme